jgi:hypothetical protein
MNPNTRDRLILGTVAILIVVIAGVIIWRQQPANTENAPEGIFWKCQNCGHEFQQTVAEYAEYTKNHYGEDMQCPKCSQKTDKNGRPVVMKATRCPYCKKYYPKVQAEVPCPFCKKMPPKSPD